MFVYDIDENVTKVWSEKRVNEKERIGRPLQGRFGILKKMIRKL